MNSYIEENFDTGFLSPRINFTLFFLSFIIVVIALVWRALA